MSIEKEETVFNLLKPIYTFQKSAFKISLIIGLGWIILILAIGILDKTTPISMNIALSIPGLLLVFLGIKEKNDIKKYNKMCRYIKEKGYKINGRVKDILNDISYVERRGNSRYRIEHKYLLIEFADEITGISGLYATPELYQIPKTKDIECDIYIVMDELPNKYKNFKYEGREHPYKNYNSNNIIADNFN